MEWLVVLGFALASSLDNFGVGIAYGIRNIRVSCFSNFVIAIICFLFSTAGIYSGLWVSNILPGLLPTIIGAVLLFFIGANIVILAAPRKSKKPVANVAPPTAAANIRGILEHPELADVDKSGEISLAEALLLGVALSSNALVNGLGAGLLALPPLAISLTAALGSFITVWAGALVGSKAAKIRIGGFSLGEAGTVLSGVILIAIAVKTIF